MAGPLIYAVAAGVCAGVAAGFIFGASLVLAGTCLLGALALLLYSRHARVLVGTIFIAGLALGLVRTDLLLQAEAQENLRLFVGQEVEIAGTVVADPERRNATLHARVAVSAVNNAPARGTLLALLPRDEPVAYGERVLLAGTLEEPQEFTTDTGRVFNYPSYLRARGISAVLPFAQLLEHEPASLSVPGTLYALKHTFTRSIERLFGEPQASLLSGLLLGERRGLPEWLTDAFIAAGLIHIVVLSGYNISIVAEGVLRALSFLPRSLGFSLGALTIFLFVVMIGGGATAVRALIMGLIAIMARYFGRSALALRALALAAVAMVLWNPLSLLYDPSCILSVIATFGLITLSPAVEALLPRGFGKAPQLRSIAASTLAVQAFVLPALLYMTGIFSLFALPANLLVLPLVPFAMALGFAAALLGLVHPLLALPAVALADLLLRAMIWVAGATEALPYATALVAEFPLWVAALAYAPLTLLALWCYHGRGSEEKLEGEQS
jgi:competence protein ComEC